MTSLRSIASARHAARASTTPSQQGETEWPTPLLPTDRYGRLVSSMCRTSTNTSNSSCSCPPLSWPSVPSLSPGPDRRGGPPRPKQRKAFSALDELRTARCPRAAESGTRQEHRRPRIARARGGGKRRGVVPRRVGPTGVDGRPRPRRACGAQHRHRSRRAGPDLDGGPSGAQPRGLCARRSRQAAPRDDPLGCRARQRRPGSREDRALGTAARTRPARRHHHDQPEVAHPREAAPTPRARRGRGRGRTRERDAAQLRRRAPSDARGLYQVADDDRSRRVRGRACSRIRTRTTTTTTSVSWPVRSPTGQHFDVPSSRTNSPSRHSPRTSLPTGSRRISSSGSAPRASTRCATAVCSRSIPAARTPAFTVFSAERSRRPDPADRALLDNLALRIARDEEDDQPPRGER